jgi:hypothetical protein
MTRGKNTLVAIRDDSNEEKSSKVLLSLKTNNLESLLNVDEGSGKNLLDPLALNFLFKTILKSDKFKLGETPSLIAGFYSLLLVNMILFAGDTKSNVAMKLIKTTCKLI